MSNPVPIFDDHWPEDGDRPARAPAGPLRMGLDDVLYDELNTPLDYYLKTFSATDDLPLDFMDQAAVQCRLAKAKARHWIEVREARKDHGVFQLVLPYLPGSAQKLLNEHAPLRHRQLLAIVAGTVAGLMEIQRLLKRPHGNLKLTNVLFRSRKLTADAVALTDPAPTMRAVERGEAGDLRKLGEMIHVLVLHRLPRGEGDWPVAPSREWQSVGRQGDRWRDLCSRLIDPRGPSVSLETTGRFLGRITAPLRIARRAVAISMAVAAALGGIAIYQRVTPSRRPTQEAVVTPHPTPIAPAIPVIKPPAPKAETTPAETIVKPVVKPPAAAVPSPIDPAAAQQLANKTLARVKGFASTAALKSGEMRIRWEEDRHRREIAQFIDDCSRPVVTSLPEVGKAIEAQSHRIAEEVNREPAKFGPAIVAERERMASRLLLADRMLKGLPKPLPLKPGTPAGERISEVLSKGVESRRAAAVTKAIAMAGQGELSDQQLDAALKGMINGVGEVHTDGAKLVAEVDQVTRMLAAGFMPDAAVDGMPIRNIVAAWSSTGSYADPDIRKAIEPLMSAVTQTDPSALKRTAASREELIGLRLAAWHASDYPAPRSAPELQTELTTRDALLHTAEVLKDSPRYQVVTQQIGAHFALRWEYFLSHAASAKDIAFALGAEVRPAGLDVTKLPAAARWNAEWLELNTVIATHDPAVLPRVHEVVAELVATGGKLPAGTVKAELLKALREWNDEQGGEDLSHLGPASVAGWTAEPDATGMVITYRPTANSDALIFRRVAMPTGDVFVCTTEMSMGVFSDVITAANRWREVRDTKLLGDPAVMGAVGPRAWQWSPRRDAGIVRSLVWLSSEWVPAGADDYPESLGGEFNRATLRPLHGESAEAMSPSRRQPMQQVSADAAQYAANLAGCRLPTPQEWKAAYASSSQQMRGANLRDKSWRLELEHMTRAWPRNNGAYRPDAGMFVPAGEALSDDVWMSAAKEEYDDGVLWFKEASPAGGEAREFLNLAGNVGEFVRDALGKVSVIGGSALSPPTRAVDKEFEVASADRRRGFSDVGFRLAFSAPAKPLERLGGILPGRDEGFVMARK